MTATPGTELEDIQRRIGALGDADLSAFRRWFAEFDARAWDRQIEADAKAGRLDRLAQRALDDHAAGRSTPR